MGPNASAPRPAALFVLGMHRSGTSAVAGTLAALGVDFGTRLYGPQRGVNEKGFWEHADITDTQDAVLRLIGSYWDDFLPLPPGWAQRPNLETQRSQLRHYLRRDFARSPLWGVKDPRLCRLLPLWPPLLTETGVRPTAIIVLRNPHQVSRSLAHRDGFSPGKSYLLWLVYTLEAVEHSRGWARAVVDFDHLLREPMDTLGQVSTELGLDYPRPLAESEPGVRGFLDTRLRHHRDQARPPAGESGSLNTLATLADSAYETLRNLPTAPAPTADPLAAVRADLDGYLTALDPVLVEQLRKVGKARGEYEQLFLEAYRSLWWKAAWPLRALERRVARRGYLDRA